MTLTKDVNADIFLVFSQRQKDVQTCRLRSYDFAVLIFLFLSPQSMDLLEKPLCVAVLKAWRATGPNPPAEISFPYKSHC